MIYENFLTLRKSVDRVRAINSENFLYNNTYKIDGYYIIPESINVDPYDDSLIIYNNLESPKNYGLSGVRQGVVITISNNDSKLFIKNLDHRNVSKDRKYYKLIESQNKVLIHYKNTIQVTTEIEKVNRVEILNRINSYRRKFAQNNLNDKDWSNDDLLIECKRLGLHINV